MCLTHWHARKKMENGGEGKSDGSCEAAASKRFLCVLFLVWIDRQWSYERKREKKNARERRRRR